MLLCETFSCFLMFDIGQKHSAWLLKHYLLRPQTADVQCKWGKLYVLGGCLWTGMQLYCTNCSIMTCFNHVNQDDCILSAMNKPCQIARSNNLTVSASVSHVKTHANSELKLWLCTSGHDKMVSLYSCLNDLDMKSVLWRLSAVALQHLYYRDILIITALKPVTNPSIANTLVIDTTGNRPKRSYFYCFFHVVVKDGPFASCCSV